VCIASLDAAIVQITNSFSPGANRMVELVDFSLESLILSSLGFCGWVVWAQLATVHVDNLRCLFCLADPPFVTNLIASNSVFIGSHTNLTCLSSGYPSPTIEWSHFADSIKITASLNPISNGSRGRTYIETVKLSPLSVQSTLRVIEPVGNEW